MRMKHLLIAAVLSCQAALFAADLIRNGSFETFGGDGIPAQWEFRVNNDAPVTVAPTTPGCDGEKSLRIISRIPQKTPHVYGVLSQMVKLKPNTEYTLTFSVRGQDVHDVTWAIGKGWLLRHAITGVTGEWKEYSFSFRITPEQLEGPDTCGIRLIIEGPCAELDLDDIRIEPKSGDIVTNGSFEGKPGAIPTGWSFGIRGDAEATIAVDDSVASEGKTSLRLVNKSSRNPNVYGALSQTVKLFPDIDYVKVKDGDEYYYLAKARLGAYYKKDAMPEIVAEMKGADLKGMQYEPLFPYFADYREKGAFRMINADFVSTEDGTGIVHTAPGFGEDDAVAGKANGIPDVCPIDEECKFTKAVPDYEGVYVKNADKDIMRRLKEEGKLVHRGTINHNYPHCWRDDSPLIYKAVSTWFVRIDRIKEKMLAANEQMSWVPAHIKEGRFGKWLENARDWAISRNRYWGCPLPIWRNKETGEMVCVGSVAELEQLSGQKITDIHKHFVDPIKLKGRDGSVLTRVPEVLDCWFESGSMPYAQNHYPFENKERFEKNFPADFIAEGQDQTRGWFYTLTVLASALFNKPAARNVVVNGMILAENGQKMSKRLKNYPDPMYIVETYGADALRLFLLGSPVVRAEDLKFSENGVKEVMRAVILPIWNSFSFFTTYANVDKWEPAADGKAPETLENPLDRWILSSLADMVEEIRNAMDTFHLQKAANSFEKFVENLTNWYIRRSRRRFWKSQNDNDKNEAYATLYYALLTFTKCAAPFIPFITEEIYRTLRTESMPESVHLCDYPEAETWRRDPYLEKQMDATMKAVSLGRFLRTQRNLKVRQPLKRAILVSGDAEIRKMLEETEEIIAEELNVKNIAVRADEEELVTLSAKANFKTLGKQLGPQMKEAAALIQALPSSQIASVLRGEKVSITLKSGTVVELGKDDLNILREEKEGMPVATEEGVTIALDTELDQALIHEGYAREFVSKVQNMRKEMNLDVSDRIMIEFKSSAEAVKAVNEFKDYIANETLAVSIAESDSAETGFDLNGQPCKVSVRKA